MDGDGVDPKCNQWVKDCLDLDPDQYALEAGVIPMQAGPAPTTPPAAKGTFTLDVKPESTVTANCTGVMDFLVQAPAKMGKPHLLGITRSAWGKPDFKTDQSGHVTDVTFSASVHITRAVGAGKWDTNNEKAVHDVEAANAAHENNHQKDDIRILKAHFDQAFMTSLIGQSLKAARKALGDAIQAANADIASAIDTLDAAEGMTSVVENADHTFTVTQIGRP